MKKILVLLLLAATTLGAQAKLGYMRTTVGYTPLYISSNNGGASETLYGGSVSFVLGIKTYKKLFVETGAGIQVNGGKGYAFIDDNKTGSATGIGFIDNLFNNSTVMVRLNVPVNLTYRFEFAKIFAVAPYAGLNFGFNLYAYSGRSLFSHSGEVFTDRNLLQYTYNPNRFQMGWQAGVRVSVIGLTVGIGYQGDFTAFDSREYLPAFQSLAAIYYGTDTPKFKTGSLVLSIGWGF